VGDPGQVMASTVKVTEADLPAIVELHQKGLGYSLNSRLGTVHLTRLYKSLLKDATSFVCCCKTSEKIPGVVSATLDPEVLTARLQAGLTLAEWISLGLKLGLHPAWWPMILESSRMAAPVIWRGILVKPCLTAIVTAPEARRQGVGRALVGAVDEFMRSHGQPAYRLDTLSDNLEAQTFYQRAGFEFIEQRGSSMIFVRGL
jgi:ribosomal protein S18 acetylase RimI-like enzyme